MALYGMALYGMEYSKQMSRNGALGYIENQSPIGTHFTGEETASGMKLPSHFPSTQLCYQRKAFIRTHPLLSRPRTTLRFPNCFTPPTLVAYSSLVCLRHGVTSPRHTRSLRVPQSHPHLHPTAHGFCMRCWSLTMYPHVFSYKHLAMHFIDIQ
jgi:hypothetical protein